MININKITLKKFIDLATKKLKGDWLLLGGTVLPLLGARHRVTQDIDFVGLGKNERSQQLEVLKIAESLNLPVEAINPAASIFVDRLVKNTKNLVLISESKSCHIYRPDTTLYFKLKVGRFSESDLIDCIEWLRFFKDELDQKTLSTLKAIIKKEVSKTTDNHDKKQRLQKLLASLNFLG